MRTLLIEPPPSKALERSDEKERQAITAKSKAAVVTKPIGEGVFARIPIT
jgi:hypothetical protein